MRFLDSNVLIYHLAADPGHGKQASDIVHSLEKSDGCVSTLVLDQVCGYLKYRGRQNIIPHFLNFVAGTPTLIKTETLFSDFAAAMDLQRAGNLPWRFWDDLVIAAQMQRLGIKEIYSFDSDFDHITGIRRLTKIF